MFSVQETKAGSSPTGDPLAALQVHKVALCSEQIQPSADEQVGEESEAGLQAQDCPLSQALSCSERSAHLNVASLQSHLTA